MRVYHTNVEKLRGTDFHEVHKKAFGLYRQIASRSKRRPYVRSAYFKKDKVFLTLEKDLFYVQIKEDKATGQKYLISIFPED